MGKLCSHYLEQRLLLSNFCPKPSPKNGLGKSHTNLSAAFGWASADGPIPQGFYQSLCKSMVDYCVTLFRCVILHKFTDSLMDSLTLSSTLDSLTIPFLFKDMVTQCSKTFLHHVYRHVSTMFTDMFAPCLHHVWRRVSTILEDLFTQCKMTCLQYVWRQV